MKTRTVSRLTCSALALACAGSSAFADVTSQEVWDMLRRVYEVNGYTVTAEQAQRAGGLQLAGVAAKILTPLPEGEVLSIAFLADQVSLADTDDGKVTITWSEPLRYEVSVFEPFEDETPDDAPDTEPETEGGDVTVPAMPSIKAGKSVGARVPDAPTAATGDSDVGEPAGEPAADTPSDTPAMMGDEVMRMTFTIAQTAPELIVSGEAGDMVTSYRAAALEMALNELIVEDETVPPIRGMLGLTNLTADTRMRDGDLWRMNREFAADALTYVFDMVVPDEEVVIHMKGQSSSLTGGFDLALPSEFDPVKLSENLPSMLRAGLDVSWKIAAGAGQSEAVFQADGDIVSSTSATESVFFSLDFDSGETSYDMAATGLETSVQGNALPFPISTSVDEMTFGLTLPLAASETPQTFGLRAGLKGVQISDLMWVMLDPTRGIPHDPATVHVDLSGQANWLLDVLNPQMVEEWDDSKPPFDLHSMRMRGLEVSAAGASLTGTGDVTFDNSDLETFEGLPAPDGRADLKLEGGHALLNNLIGMGVLSEQDAMTLRMMVAMFTNSDPETDTLTTTFEVKPDGAISANGNRLQ